MSGAELAGQRSFSGGRGRGPCPGVGWCCGRLSGEARDPQGLSSPAHDSPEPLRPAACFLRPPAALLSQTGSSLISLLGREPGFEAALAWIELLTGRTVAAKPTPEPGSWPGQGPGPAPGHAPIPLSPKAEHPLGKSRRVPGAGWGGGSVGGHRDVVQNVPLKGRGSILLKREQIAKNISY